jgi:hypothetical protein
LASPPAHRPPGRRAVDAELRARILFTLAARGLARGEDIDVLPRLDPVTGDANRATCLALKAANAAEPPDNVLRLTVADQATIMRRRLAAHQRH